MVWEEQKKGSLAPAAVVRSLYPLLYDFPNLRRAQTTIVVGKAGTVNYSYDLVLIYLGTVAAANYCWESVAMLANRSLAGTAYCFVAAASTGSIVDLVDREAFVDQLEVSFRNVPY